MLLTNEVGATMPETVKEVYNFGRIQVRFPALNGNDMAVYGINYDEGNEKDLGYESVDISYDNLKKKKSL